jgi:hypothetical protein
MTEPLKCDKCGNTSLSLLSSNIQGLDRVIDIYFCRKCQTGKTVSTLRQSEVINDTPLDVDVSVDDGDYETIEPENPYEDDDGGWDPNIG